MLLERFCPVPLAPSNKAMEEGVKIPRRTTDTGELHPCRHPLGPWGLLVLHGLCNAEAGKPAPAWNEPRGQGVRAVTGLLHPSLQGRALVIDRLVLSLLWSSAAACTPAAALARLGRGAQCCFWPGCTSPGLASGSSWPWRRKGRAAGQHTQLGPNLPPPGPAGTLP